MVAFLSYLFIISVYPTLFVLLDNWCQSKPTEFYDEILIFSIYICDSTANFIPISFQSESYRMTV